MSMFKSKSNRRKKVRRMGNFSTHIEFMIYLVMGLIILICIGISLYSQ